MRSKLTIVTIVLGVGAVCIAAQVGVVLWLGLWPGLALGAGLAVVAVATYRSVIGPWQHRWGASDAEVARRMPGDEIIPDAASTTRAVSIGAPPDQVWPWLVQIGFGRAGWYSYDWIDNDGQPSATTIRPDLQDLQPGDQIVMVPGLGPSVQAIDPGRSLLAGDAESGTWCLGLYPDAAGGTRLVSRWRQAWSLSPATAFWILVADPGAFIMERRMLLGIKQRAELASERPVTR